jgi:hypothetical protein
MPGTIIRATCGCGYEKELEPGASEISGQSFGIAYNQIGDEIGTFNDNVIAKKKLLKVADPGLEDPPFSEGAPLPIICPKCKNLSLFLHCIGNWD